MRLFERTEPSGSAVAVEVVDLCETHQLSPRCGLCCHRCTYIHCGRGEVLNEVGCRLLNFAMVVLEKSCAIGEQREGCFKLAR